MPTAPFGLAYGLGAGMAIAPQQMFNRQEQANQLAMQGLQQQLMQHQVAQQQAEDRAFSQPVQPQMDQPTTQQSMQSVLGTPPPMQGGIPMAPGTVAQGQAPSLAQATAPTEHKYVTPYEKMAYEYGQRADKLAKMGFGRSAMALQQQAAQYGMLHQQTAMKMAGHALGLGDPSAALPYLNSIGYGLKNISQDPSNPGNYLVQRDVNGETMEASIPKEVAAAVGDPQTAQVIANIQWRKAMSGAAQTRATAYAQGQESLVQHRQDMKAHYERMDNRAQKAFGGTYNTLPAAQKNAIWYAKLHGISEKDASDLFVPGASRNTVTSAKALNALAQVNKQIITRYGGTLPDANSQDEREKADYALYTKNQDEIAKIGQEMASERGKKPVSQATPTETPKQNYEGEISPSGAYKFSGGKWIPNK